MDKIPIKTTITKYSHLLSISTHCKVKNGHIFLLNAYATTVSSTIHSLHEYGNFSTLTI